MIGTYGSSIGYYQPYGHSMFYICPKLWKLLRIQTPEFLATEICKCTYVEETQGDGIILLCTPIVCNICLTFDSHPTGETSINIAI